MSNKNEKKTNKKKAYKKPHVQSESMLVYGALCNGSRSGGRKQSTGAPDFCSSSKLLS